MGKKYFTLMILSDATSQIKKYKIHKNMLKGLGLVTVVFGLLLTGIFGTLIYNYKQLSQQVEKLAEYRQNYNNQQVHLQTLENTIGRFKKELTNLSTSNRKFRVMAGFPEPKTQQQFSGIGGENETSFQEFAQKCEDNALKKMFSDLDKLKFDMAYEQNNLQDLTEEYTDKTSYLASTPSIAPSMGWMTSGFGYRQSPFTGEREFHGGLDFAARFGSPVYATADGIVIFAGRKGGLGKAVILDHGYGYVTRYGHASETLVQPGDKVKRGQIIARIGSTGRSTAPHVHYEVRVNNVAVNPYKYINFN